MNTKKSGEKVNRDVRSESDKKETSEVYIERVLSINNPLMIAVIHVRARKVAGETVIEQFLSTLRSTSMRL